MRKAIVRNKSGAGTRTQEANKPSPPAVVVLHQPLAAPGTAMVVGELRESVARRAHP